MKRQRAEISSNVISHIKPAHPIEMWRSNKLGIKEKISRGKFPRLIFSCPVPTGLPHRSHCVPMNIIRCDYRVSYGCGGRTRTYGLRVMRDILGFNLFLYCPDATKLRHLGVQFLMRFFLLPHCLNFIESTLG